MKEKIIKIINDYSPDVAADEILLLFDVKGKERTPCKKSDCECEPQSLWNVKGEYITDYCPKCMKYF